MGWGRGRRLLAFCVRQVREWKCACRRAAHRRPRENGGRRVCCARRREREQHSFPLVCLHSSLVFRSLPPKKLPHIHTHTTMLRLAAAVLALAVCAAAQVSERERESGGGGGGSDVSRSRVAAAPRRAHAFAPRFLAFGTPVAPPSRRSEDHHVHLRALGWEFRGGGRGAGAWAETNTPLAMRRALDATTPRGGARPLHSPPLTTPEQGRQSPRSLCAIGRATGLPARCLLAHLPLTFRNASPSSGPQTTALLPARPHVHVPLRQSRRRRSDDGHAVRLGGGGGQREG